MRTAEQRRKILQLQLLPTEGQILECLFEAWNDAVVIAANLEMIDKKSTEKGPCIRPVITHVNDITFFDKELVCENENEDSADESLAENVDFSSEETARKIDELSDVQSVAELEKDVEHDLLVMAAGCENVENVPDPNSLKKGPFTLYTDEKGCVHLIKKSTLCWILTQDNSKMSSDRLLRVQTKEKKIVKKM